MSDGISKISWVDRARATRKFHIERLKENPKQRVKDTAHLLHRSFGSVAEDILIASWLKTHETRIMSFKTQAEALKFIRDKTRQLEMDEIE